MRRAMTALALTAVATPALAKDPPRKPADAKASAERFQLDLTPTDEATPPAEPAPAAAPSPDAARFGIDTPIAQLLANYRSKAVLDKDMPGLSTDKNLDTLKPLSLRKLAPLSGGRLTPELLDKVDEHLRAIE